MSEILLAGASGLIGSKLILKLKQKNYKIVLLSTQKSKQTSPDILYWNPEERVFPEIDLNRFAACINFCGAGIFDEPFTNERKDLLLKSRIKPIQFLIEQYKKQNVQCPHFLSASASGFYPNICLNELSENSTHGDGFISNLVQEWEKAALSFDKQANKTSIIRIGIVLAKEGGFLKKVTAPMKFFAGAVPGSGEQIVSWIHIDDLCDLFIHVFENGLNGIFNATAPKPATLAFISKQAGYILKRPIWLPNIPEFMLKIIFGKDRSDLLMCSQEISSSKIVASGFNFKYQNSKSALMHLLK